MYEFSETSKSILVTCDKRIQLICNVAIKVFDFSVLCKKSSLAVDLAPYPIDMDDIARFYGLAGRIKEAAYSNSLDIIWGGCWDDIKDYGHFELKAND